MLSVLHDMGVSLLGTAMVLPLILAYVDGAVERALWALVITVRKWQRDRRRAKRLSVSEALSRLDKQFASKQGEAVE